MKLEMIKYLSAFFLIIAVISGCKPDDTVPLKYSQEVRDSSALFIERDIFLTYRVDEGGEDDHTVLYNHGDGFVSEVEGYRPGHCEYNPFTDSVMRYIQVERMLFKDSAQLEGTFEIELSECVPQMSEEENIRDIVFKTGDRPFLSVSDSVSGVQLAYRDEDGVYWSSNSGPNSGDNSRFILSAVIDNNLNNKYKYIVFGEFEGFLYNGRGGRMKLTRGKFKMFARINDEDENDQE